MTPTSPQLEQELAALKETLAVQQAMLEQLHKPLPSRRPLRRWLYVSLFLLLCLGVQKSRNLRADGIPSSGTLYYAGVLQVNGQPANGNQLIEVALYDAAQGGNKVCATGSLTVSTRDGNFRMQLPSACVDQVRINNNLYAEVSYQGQPVLGRNKLASVPYAVVADTLFSKTLTDNLKLISNVATSDQTDLKAKNRVRDATGLVSPSGTVVAYAGATPPTGWVLCHGQLLDKAQHPDLYKVLGATYGETATQFRVPDLRGRVVVSLDAGQGEFNSLGKTGGTKTHILTLNEIPPHNHNVRDLGHSHPIVQSGNDNNGAYNDWGSAYSKTTNTLTGRANIAQDNRGGGQAHNILQPYLTLHYIIRL